MTYRPTHYNTFAIPPVPRQRPTRPRPYPRPRLTPPNTLRRRIRSYLGLAWATLGLYIAYASDIPWSNPGPHGTYGLIVSFLVLSLMFFLPGLAVYSFSSRPKKRH